MTCQVANLFLQPKIYGDDINLTDANADLTHIDDCLNYNSNRIYPWLAAHKLTLS